MKEDYCTYELSKKLKEKGFNWPCNHFYSTFVEIEKSYIYADWNDSRDLFEVISAPALSQAQKWLREEKDTIVVVNPNFLDEQVNWEYSIRANGMSVDSTMFYSYEEALSVGITRALELI